MIVTGLTPPDLSATPRRSAVSTAFSSRMQRSRPRWQHRCDTRAGSNRAGSCPSLICPSRQAQPQPLPSKTASCSEVRNAPNSDEYASKCSYGTSASSYDAATALTPNDLSLTRARGSAWLDRITQPPEYIC